MKIYSWNVLFRNAELDRALEFIRTSDFDIFCLQEVPSDFLDQLLALPYHHAYTIDGERLKGSQYVPIFIVVLSKYPLSNERVVPFPDYWDLLPLRTRVAIRLMKPWHFTRVRNRTGLAVDVAGPAGSIHLFNLHLVLAHPTWRLQEFERAMTERDSTRPAIVCGDFNILESPVVSLLNWLFAGKVRDALFHRRERTTIEKRFVAHELMNPLRGETTHSIARSQLDHILVSHTFSIKKAEVINDRHGSDHNPIYTELICQKV